jgi:hypothetical protein
MQAIRGKTAPRNQNGPTVLSGDALTQTGALKKASVPPARTEGLPEPSVWFLIAVPRARLPAEQTVSYLP